MVKVKIHSSSDNQFYFTIEKNQVSTTSETYTRKANAIKSAKNLIDAIWSTQMDDLKIIDTTKKSSLK
jgi:uncharacterized protein YegP (UPF0339 family)